MRTLWIFAILVTLVAPAAAQTGAADYAIENVQPPQLSADGSMIEVSFDVTNLGSTAPTTATIHLVDKETGQEIANQNLRPLRGGESLPILLTFPIETLPAGQSHTLLVSVGIDEVEQEADGIANNMANIDVPPPEQLQPVATPTPTPAPGPEAVLRQFGFDPADPVHIAALVGLGVFLLVALVLLIIILRALFRRRPHFDVHLPPYANVPVMAPSTAAGRRQGWQIHAQNDLLPPSPANEGATHIRKLLTGVDSTKLTNWQITGLRLNQYDQYGRVARSEVVAARKICRSLSKTADRAPTLGEDQISRRVRPIAKSLVKQLQRKINPRSAVLPIAMDIAFQGVHGEVRIRFELFYLEQGHWRMADTWEPEMTVAGKAIHENYTYTLHGQRLGEPFGTFVRRLQDDLTVTLTDMIKPELSDTGRSQPVQTVRE